MKRIICALFHPITILYKNYFTDIVSGKNVGKYRCEKCDVTFMANRKRSFWRVKSN